MPLPQPITNTDVYLAAVLNALIEVNEKLTQVASELQQLSAAVTQKPVVQLDVVKLADSITSVLQKQHKSTK